MTIEEKITALPHSANKIAAKLKELGIRGKKHSAKCCPIARYIDYFGASVLVFTIAPDGLFGDQLAIPLPEYVSDFIVNFGQGDYPKLEETEDTEF